MKSAGDSHALPNTFWKRLHSGDGDPELWAQARDAGWTRERTAHPKSRFSPLAIRIPMGSIDWLARPAAEAGGLIFSVAAIAFWSSLIALAGLLVVARSHEFATSLGALATYLQQTSPLILVGVFVFTKSCHELGHAAMCRRMGARPGEVGVLLLCGMPCPYCDVTDVWRQPSAIRRAAVMMAGVYVELIIAALATLVWCFATDPDTRMLALNLMVICGISTIVFNANPLMRYDGYYVLADFLGSPNLRQESQNAFRSVVTRVFAGRRYAARAKGDWRSRILAVYHLMSSVYRIVIFVAIAALFIGVAEWFQLRSFAVAIVVLLAAMMIGKAAVRLENAARGQSRWSNVSLARRTVCVSLCLFMIAVVLCIPMPRYRRAAGLVDSADAVTVFLPETGRVGSVAVDFGDQVSVGQDIVRLENSEHQIQANRFEGQFRLAKLRGQLSRQRAIDGTSATSETADQWRTLQAAEEAARSQLVSARQRLTKTTVQARVDGTIIPGNPTIGSSASGVPKMLIDQQGTTADSTQPWCRISPEGKLHVALSIDARDREMIGRGTPVKIHLACTGNVVPSVVASVSQTFKRDNGGIEQSTFQALCEIPSVDSDRVVSMIGQQCNGVFRLPNRSLASDFVNWLGEWIRG